MSRTRIVHPGPVTLEGRAWSGRAPVTGVEVSTDGGTTWRAAALAPDDGHRWAWRHWRLTWTATPGGHVLSARAADADGHTQPPHPPWNRGGFANNAVQRVDVLCVDQGREQGAWNQTAQI